MIDVYNDGGKVRVSAKQTGDELSIQLIGNATFTARGTLELSENGTITVLDNRETNEQEDYLKLESEVKHFLQRVK